MGGNIAYWRHQLKRSLEPDQLARQEEGDYWCSLLRSSSTSCVEFFFHAFYHAFCWQRRHQPPKPALSGLLHLQFFTLLDA